MEVSMHFTTNFMPYLILTLLKIEFFNLHLKESTVRNTGCLPFSWDNQSVDGLGEWYAKIQDR